MCKFNAVPIAPRQLMLQKAQHCAPKKERIYPLQFQRKCTEFCAHREESSNSPRKESAIIFTKCFPKKNTPLVSSRRVAKFTLRIWLRSVTSRKTRISIRHAGINVKVKAQQKKRVYCSRHGKRTTKVALVKATKHKANPATDEVRVENRNHCLA